jgi:hypothetical protein
MRLLIACAAVAILASHARAEVWAYTDPSQGSQNWPGNLGLDFTVNTPIYVDSLGVYNQAGSGLVAGGPISVAIYDSSGDQITSAVFSNGSTYALSPGGYDLTQGIPGVVLGPGNYSVVAVGFSSSDLNGNTNLSDPGPALNTDNGAITFTGARYDGNTTLDYPAADPSLASTQFEAGTFGYDVTPEPETCLLFAGALAMIGVKRLKRA